MTPNYLKLGWDKGKLCSCRGSIHRTRNGDEGIDFGVARLEKPRSESASAPTNPGGFEAPATIPSSLLYKRTVVNLRKGTSYD